MTRAERLAGREASGPRCWPAGSGPAQPALLSIPVAAYLPGKGEAGFVFVFDEASGTVVRHEITLASISEDRAFVRADIAPGTIIASRGVAFLNDGERVTLKDAGLARYNP